MCAGSVTNYKISEDKVKKLSLLHHRGPDGRSTSTHIYNDKIISFSHPTKHYRLKKKDLHNQL